MAQDSVEINDNFDSLLRRHLGNEISTNVLENLRRYIIWKLFDTEKLPYITRRIPFSDIDIKISEDFIKYHISINSQEKLEFMINKLGKLLNYIDRATFEIDYNQTRSSTIDSFLKQQKSSSRGDPEKIYHDNIFKSMIFPSTYDDKNNSSLNKISKHKLYDPKIFKLVKEYFEPATIKNIREVTNYDTEQYEIILTTSEVIVKKILDEFISHNYGMYMSDLYFQNVKYDMLIIFIDDDLRFPSIFIFKDEKFQAFQYRNTEYNSYISYAHNSIFGNIMNSIIHILKNIFKKIKQRRMENINLDYLFEKSS